MTIEEKVIEICNKYIILERIPNLIINSFCDIEKKNIINNFHIKNDTKILYFLICSTSVNEAFKVVFSKVNGIIICNEGLYTESEFISWQEFISSPLNFSENSVFLGKKSNIYLNSYAIATKKFITYLKNNFKIDNTDSYVDIKKIYEICEEFHGKSEYLLNNNELNKMLNEIQLTKSNDHKENIKLMNYYFLFYIKKREVRITTPYLFGLGIRDDGVYIETSKIKRYYNWQEFKKLNIECLQKEVIRINNERIEVLDAITLKNLLTDLQKEDFYYQEKIETKIEEVNSIPDNVFNEVIVMDLNIDINKMQLFIDRIDKSKIKSGKDFIGTTAKMVFYKDVDINKKDNYIIESLRPIANKIVVVNEDYKVCSVLSTKQIGNNKYLIDTKKPEFLIQNQSNYSFIYFDFDIAAYISKNIKIPANEEENKMISIPVNNNIYQTEVDLRIKVLEQTNTLLCIDFGTSNTTVGCYLDNKYVSEIPYNEVNNKTINIDDINIVSFFDNCSDEYKESKLIPTIVYVDDCSDKDNIQYSFGYDAAKKIKALDYCPKASAFYSIKRWVNSCDVEEILKDEIGNSVVVKRSEIIKAYLLYIIAYAEQQFKCKFKNLHISSPVKLKRQFLDMFEKILPEYNIEKETALDEGIAVIYNTISERFESEDFHGEEENKALIIDCGGGTTDLATCEYKISTGDYSYLLDIKTGFENGDSNFGGNNLTFRIMQYMKILFATHYTNQEKPDIDKLIPVIADNIFRETDKFGVDYIYQNLNNKYDEMESIIPTKYKSYENKPSSEYQKVRNNFYFLWELAEEMKKQFFEKTNLIRNKFSSSNNGSDADLHVTIINKWKLSVMKNDKLEEVINHPDIIFNIKEINKLLKADIYEVIRKFLDKFYNDDSLGKYKIIKLTGQSCKIDIFKDAIKEYVPGKSIKFNEIETMELKLSCLKGVIKYFREKKAGKIEVDLKNEIPVIPYSVVAKKFNNEDVELIKNQSKADEAIGMIGRALNTEYLELYLMDRRNNFENKLNTYVYNNKEEFYVEGSVEKILDELDKRESQETINNIKNNSINFFVFTDKNSWGFYVLPVRRKDNILEIGKKEYFSFEEELSVLNFFDGEK